MPKVKTAIILLAGMGSRLRPLTETTHKALISIGGATLLERQIGQLRKNGVSEISLVLGHRADEIKDFVGRRYPDLRVSYVLNKRYRHTNTAYSLWLALQHIQEPFLLLDGDVILDQCLLKPLCADTTDNLLLCETQVDKLNAEAVKARLNAKGEVTELGKSVDLKHACGESIGIGLLQSDWAACLKSLLDKDMRDRANWNWYYEDAMQKILSLNKEPSPLRIHSTQNLPWVEIDDHADLKLAQSLFAP